MWMEITIKNTRAEGEMNYLNDPYKENKIGKGSLGVILMKSSIFWIDRRTSHSGR